MTLLEIIRKRCSVRNYDTAPIEREKIDYLMEAARLAPSACNNQPWRFIIAQDEEAKKAIDAYPREWAKSVPLFIIICADHTKSWKRPADGKDHADIDAAIAATHICLAATEKELGTCITCHFDVPKLKISFNLPAHIEPIIIISVGYPADKNIFETTPKRRSPLNEIIL